MLRRSNPGREAALGFGIDAGYGGVTQREPPDSGGAWQFAGISVPGSPRRRRALHSKPASLVTVVFGWQPQRNKSECGYDQPGSRGEWVGHRRCPRWSGYARQAAIVGAAEVSG